MQEILLTEKEFKSIRTKGGVYVDKTKHIYDIFRRDLYFFIARPRRFGKSLLCSTLRELFAGNRDLFKGLWIDNSDWQWEKLPVIHLDMSAAAGKTATAADVRKGIVDLLLKNAKNLGIADLEKDFPFLMLKQLIEKAHELYGHKTVVIIDEYDKPVLDAIDDKTRRDAIHKEISDLYSQLKPAEEHLRCVLITGVFKFTQTSIFSGLNNLNDITFDPAAAALIGYTEDEIRLFFAEHLAALAAQSACSVDEMMHSLQKQYNGYSFGVNITTKQLFGRVYNSFALNYVFAKQQQLDRWFASGTPTALVKKLIEEQLQTLDQKELYVPFNLLEQSSSPDKISSILLLYYAGYVTMKACTGTQFNTMITLDFPNESVKKAFAEALLPEITQLQDIMISRLVMALQHALAEQQLDQLQQLLNDALANVSYTLLAKADEKPANENFYHIIFTILFSACGMRVTNEEHTNRGRMDIVIDLDDVIYVIELKINQSARVALDQIKDRQYPAKFRHLGKKLYAVGVSISTALRLVQEVAWEAIP